MPMSAQVINRGIKSSATAALAVLTLALAPASLQAKVIKVPSGAIDTIQQGVDAAAPGDTVIVMPGTYVCNDATDWPGAVHIWSSKPGLKLKAAGPVKIVGPGSGTGIAIAIEADNASVEGFEISGFGRGITAWGQADGTQTRITGNTIHDCSSILIQLGGFNNYEVAHNTMVGGVHGIFLGSELGTKTQHHLHNNRVTDAQADGIRLDMAPGSRLDHNVSDNNGWDGIYLARSPNCTADHNQTDNNGYSGIEVGNSPNCAVTASGANNNAERGIYVWLSCGSSFELNEAEGNGQYDLFIPPWTDPDPTCNTYLNNRAGTAYPSLDLWDVKSSQ